MAIAFARVIDRLEDCFARHDMDGAERLLLYWEQEAHCEGDLVGLCQIRNEMLGLYRRLNDKDKGLAVAERLLPLLGQETVGDATMLLNIATNYCHFGQHDKATPLYAVVERVYKALLSPDDYRMAGLYNNMAAHAMATAQYADAEALYQKALDVVGKIQPTIPELAVTLVNLAVSIYRRSPLDERVDAYMLQALDVLYLPALPHDGNYYFVLGKVEPVFGHLGYRNQMEQLHAFLDGQR